jgi:hypothetical protein
MLTTDTPLPKRKHKTKSGRTRSGLFGSILRGFLRYTIVYPIRFVWNVSRWSLVTVWSLIRWIVGLPSQLWSWFRNGSLPNFENVYQREAYLRIKRRFRRKRRFQFHVMIFALFNITSIFEAFSRSWYGSISWNVWNDRIIFGLVWLGVLAFHFMRDRMAETEERELAQVMSEYRHHSGDARRQREAEKRKNMLYEETEDYLHYEDYDGQVQPMTDDHNARLHLMDDGELQLIEETPPPQQRGRTRRS